VTKIVFISHSSQDYRLANEIRRFLEEREIPCWIAPRDIPPGSSYGEEIIKAIEQCAVTLLVFTGKANQSRAVANELELSFARERVILPVRLEEIEPSSNIEFWLSRTQWVDAFLVPLRRRINDIIPIIQAVAAGQPAPKAPPQSVSALGRIEKIFENSIRYPVLTVTLGGIILIVILTALWSSVGRQEKLIQDNATTIALDASTFGLVTLTNGSNSSLKNSRNITATIYLNLKKVPSRDIQIVAKAKTEYKTFANVNLSHAIEPSLTEDVTAVDFTVPSSSTGIAVCMTAKHPTLGEKYTAEWNFDLRKPDQIGSSIAPRVFKNLGPNC
jgi:hypothetical protein